MTAVSVPARVAARASRGMSLSVLFALLVPSLLLVCGLAIDGASKAAADRRAEAVAAQAARAGPDAAAPLVISGQDGAATAPTAARSVVAAHAGMSGSATVDADGRLTVTTETSVATTFLSLIGVDTLPARGSAVVELRPR